MIGKQCVGCVNYRRQTKATKPRLMPIVCSICSRNVSNKLITVDRYMPIKKEG